MKPFIYKNIGGQQSPRQQDAYAEATIERQMPLHVGAEELQLVQSSVTCVSHALQKMF